MVSICLRSALDTDAGEIIVSDDCSPDETASVLSEFKDPRLKIVFRNYNIGLWANHFALLKLTNKPWIKFLQNDDRISPGGLKAMCDIVSENTSVVSALPVFEYLSTGERKKEFLLSNARHWSSDEYMERLLTVGNELGAPSNTLFRSASLIHEPEAWRNDHSCDLIANVHGASKGEVVLMPPGPVINGCHENQDTITCSLELSIKRLRNTVNYLHYQDDVRIRKFALVFSIVEGIGSIRAAFGAIRSGKSIYRGLIGDILSIMFMCDNPFFVREKSKIVSMMRWKYMNRLGKCLDASP